ncbi:hypothetical protein MC885_009790 [Smutsia gigantea]|nr:hypothetical protein MC885_009790 [Smutsia gigantea]
MGLEVGGLSSIELLGIERFVAGETQVWEGGGSKKLSHNGSHDCHNSTLGPGGVGHRAGSGESRSGLLSVLGVYVGRKLNLNFDLPDSVQVSQITCSAFSEDFW